MSALDAAIVVVGTNNGAWLAECFSSLTENTRRDAHLLVYVDNASTDGSVQAIERDFPHVVILQSGSNLGFAAANNLGMRLGLERGARHLILINPDTRTPPGLIDELVLFLDRHPEYGIVGPLQQVYDGEGPNSWSLHALDNGERHVFHHWAPQLSGECGAEDGRAPQTLEHAYVQGAAMAYRGALARKVGLLDARYHTFYEEVDLCRRVRWAGSRVALLTDLWIEHHGGSQGPPSAYRRFHMTRNRYFYLFTDPALSRRVAVRLTASWLRDDVLRQLPEEDGLVGSLGEYLKVWSSILWNAPGLWQTRRRNHAARG